MCADRRAVGERAQPLDALRPGALDAREHRLARPRPRDRDDSPYAAVTDPSAARLTAAVAGPFEELVARS